MTTSDESFRKLETWGTACGGVALFLFSIFSFASNAWRVFQSADTAWLVRTGEYILGHGLPTTDLFSWTCPGRPWVVYQWLFEAGTGFLYQINGFWMVGLGAYLLSALVCLWLMPAQMLRAGVKSVYVFGLLSLVFTAVWFFARPQLVSFLLIPVFVNLLEHLRVNGFTRRQWLLPLLMVLWTNSHSFWFVGLSMILLYVLGLFPKASSKTRISLLTVLLTSVLAVLVNPYGFQLITYNCSFLTETDPGIWELQPHLVLHPFVNIEVVSYFVLVWSAMIYGRSNVPLIGLLLAAISTVAALCCYRFTPVAILLSWPYAGLALAKISFAQLDAEDSTDRISRISFVVRKSLLRWLPLVAVIVGIAGYTFEYPLNKPIWFTYANSNQKAVEYLKKHPQLLDRMFCDDAVGCSLIYEKLALVFIDNRFDFYGKKFYDEYQSCMHAEGDWQGYLDNWKISSICIKTNCSLYRELKCSKNWNSLYDDGVTSVWQRITDGR